MKALTLWQPWASLMVNGRSYGQWLATERLLANGNWLRTVRDPWKFVETRCWDTKYRGPIAIHSALRKEKWLGRSSEGKEFMQQYALTGLPPFDKLPLGCILGIGTVAGIQYAEEHVETISDMERTFGNYEKGRYAWIFGTMEQFQKPIPVKGNRMLWEWKDAESYL